MRSFPNPTNSVNLKNYLKFNCICMKKIYISGKSDEINKIRIWRNKKQSGKRKQIGIDEQFSKPSNSVNVYKQIYLNSYAFVSRKYTCTFLIKVHDEIIKTWIWRNKKLIRKKKN